VYDHVLLSGYNQSNSTFVNVLPITLRKPGRKTYPNEVLLPDGSAGIEKESIILCYQIRTLDKKRLIKAIGKIDSPELHESIFETLFFQLGIAR